MDELNKNYTYWQMLLKEIEFKMLRKKSLDPFLKDAKASIQECYGI